MNIEIIRQPQYKMELSEKETIAVRNALSHRLADATIPDKEKKQAQPILDTLVSLGLGEL